MSQSFVRQGVNIVCSNMTISSPRKLGLHPDKEPIKTLGITINTAIPEPLLNVFDKKIDDCFKCKMAKKTWGGLAAFFAGVAIVAIVVVAVVTLPVSGPIAVAIAGTALAGALTTTAVIGSIATISAIAASAYTVYKLSHECDKIFDAEWLNFHETVLIEKEYALLNSSYMVCPVGGKLNIIIDDVLALQAARLIASANNKEVFFHWGSKFINGAIAFSLGGPVGVTIASGLEIYSTVTDDGLSNKGTDPLGDSVTAIRDHTASTVAEAVVKQSLINNGGSKILDVVITGMNRGILTEAQGDAVLGWLVRNGEKFSWGSLGTNFLKGLGGAVIGFAVDQVSNKFEEHYEQQAGASLDLLNNQDELSVNNIKIIATTK